MNVSRNEIKKLSGEMSEIEADMTEDNFAVIENFEHRMRTLIRTVLSEKDPDYWQNCLTAEFRDRVQERIDKWLKETPGSGKDVKQLFVDLDKDGSGGIGEAGLQP